MGIGNRRAPLDWTLRSSGQAAEGGCPHMTIYAGRGSCLLASEGGEDVGGDDADAEEDAGGGQNENYARGKYVCPPRADQVAHNFFVVDQHEKEHQCWGHGENCDYVYDENYVDQRQAGD